MANESDTPVVVQPRLRRRRVLGSIADHNPFYLISAACMLWGCLAITNSHSWWSIPLSRLLTLIATLNVYEAALIALAVLLVRNGSLRDSRVLLILEAFFLVDISFLNAEIMTANLFLGLAINAVLLLLAAVKLYFVARALGGISLGKQVFVLMQLGVLAFLPAVLRALDTGSVSPLSFYVLWWIVGLMPVLNEVRERLWKSTAAGSPGGWAELYVVLPWLSLIAHLATLHYVYDVRFYGAMAAPVLLGLTLVLQQLQHLRERPLLTSKEMLSLRALLPAAAVLVSLNNPYVLNYAVAGWPSLYLTPMRLVIPAAYLMYVYIFFLRHAVMLLSAGACVAGAVFFGPTPAEIQAYASNIWSEAMGWANWAMPRTAMGWGVLSVVASFLFLGLGATVSFGKSSRQADPIDEASPG